MTQINGKVKVRWKFHRIPSRTYFKSHRSNPSQPGRQHDLHFPSAYFFGSKWRQDKEHSTQLKADPLLKQPKGVETHLSRHVCLGHYIIKKGSTRIQDRILWRWQLTATYNFWEICFLKFARNWENLLVHEDTLLMQQCCVFGWMQCLWGAHLHQSSFPY